MNVGLLDPFATVPDVLESSLDYGDGVSLAFNGRGSLLAVGCHDGRTIIWDFETRNVARILLSHTRPVTAVCWSRKGRKLLTSSIDWTVIKWDVVNSSIDRLVRFDCPVMSCQFHPKNSNLGIVCLTSSPGCVVDFKTGLQRRLPSTVEGGTHGAATFDQTGKWIFSAQTGGSLLIISSDTLEIVKTVPSKTNSAIKGLEVSSDGHFLLVNSTDKILRVFSIDPPSPFPSLTLQSELQDHVNKPLWKCACFSADAEHVVASCSKSTDHKLFIWSRQDSRLAKLLEGPKEGVQQITWHPHSPIIVSASNTGMLYVWTATYTENWSAFAPDFEELEENFEYIEREDEFDIVDEYVTSKRHLPHQDNSSDSETEIDIETNDRLMSRSFLSDTNGDDLDPNDSDEDLFFLPTIPDPDPLPTNQFFRFIHSHRENP